MSNVSNMEDKLEQLTLPKKKGDQSKVDYCKEHYGKGFPNIDRVVDRELGKKRCGICEVLFDNTLAFYHKNPQTKDGLHYNCKVCRNDAKKAYYRDKLKNLKE